MQTILLHCRHIHICLASLKFFLKYHKSRCLNNPIPTAENYISLSLRTEKTILITESIQCNTVQYSTEQHNGIQHKQHNTTQNSATQLLPQWDSKNISSRTELTERQMPTWLWFQRSSKALPGISQAFPKQLIDSWNSTIKESSLLTWSLNFSFKI